MGDSPTEKGGLLSSLRRRLRREPVAAPQEDGFAPTLGEEPDPSPVLDLDDSIFEASTEGGWTVVDFWAPWCGPCRAFHPVFDEVAGDTDGIRFARLNVDTSPRAASLLGIQTIPTVVLFDTDGNEVERIVGVPRRKDFDALLERRHAAGNAPA